MYRASHLAAPIVWTEQGLDPQAVSQYTKVVEQTNGRPIWLSSPRLPGRARYLAALDKAVDNALAGTKPPAESLAEAAEAWRRITDELGVEKQRNAYMRSLGLDP